VRERTLGVWFSSIFFSVCRGLGLFTPLFYNLYGLTRNIQNTKEVDDRNGM
jgi:hypothetical protein